MKKDLVNQANRIQNCDQANIDKTLAASEKQIAEIRRLQAGSNWRMVPEKLREMALLRLENPEASLAELGAMLDPPLSKAGVNNRLARISELAKKG